MTKCVAFLVVGGPHQVFHLAPVAAALSVAQPDTEVTLFATTARELALAREAAHFYPGAAVCFERLAGSCLLNALSKVFRRTGIRKLSILWRNRRLLQRMDAVVVAECTSTILRRMGLAKSLLICIPHGAGDRAVSFEPRFRLFDRVLVAGKKTRERMIASGVDADRVVVTGYPKADLADRMALQRAPLFDNDRPVVLYNPHFRRSLSSLGDARQIVAAFAADERFNLIVAPHLRAFADAPAQLLSEWNAFATPDKVLVDLNSNRLVDMTYTTAADIYLGDVSSQVYEFLLHPRPCVFVNAHGVQWRNDPDYAFWKLGEVVAPGEVVEAVARASEKHHAFDAAQRAAVEQTFAAVGSPAFVTAEAVYAALSQ